jgi:Domain of unknown function (DUF1707)
MDTAAPARDYPSGELRASDADRDRALAELSEAFQVGRITADELDQRSARVLRARTGKELTAPLADLPLELAPAARSGALERAHRVLAARIAMGASAAAATGLAAVAATNALSNGPDLQRRELAREVLARMGLSIRIPSAPGFDWAGAIVPGALAVALVVLIVFLHVNRADRA